MHIRYLTFIAVRFITTDGILNEKKNIKIGSKAITSTSAMKAKSTIKLIFPKSVLVKPFN
jgi:hypothetical protein